MSFSDIRNALLELDDNNLQFDNLKAISKQLPTLEEVCVHRHTSSQFCLSFDVF